MARPVQGSGWTLFGLNEPVSRWTGAVRELVKLDKAATKRGAASSSTYISIGTWDEIPVRASEKLPQGALHVVERRKPNPAYKPHTKDGAPLEGPYDSHYFIGGDEQSTWIVVCENESLARAKLLEAIAGGASGIGSRTELAPMKSLPAGGVGFATLQGVFSLFKDENTLAQIEETAQTFRMLRGLPSAGNEPMFVSLASVQGAGKTGVTLRATATLSIVAAVDILQWMQSSPSAPPPPTP